VYDPSDLATPPVVLDLEGEDPRALATDGTTVYAAIFESGNGTTILRKQTVSSDASPYSGQPNPPPNSGLEFDPPMTSGLPAPPEASLIVRKNDAGAWHDDNGGDWTAAVTWDLHDHDVAVIDAATLAVSYASGLMNANMALAVRPAGAANGAEQVTVVGTDGINEVRFEPNIKGIFVRVMGATITGAGIAASLVDLNPHLDYSTPTVAQAVRDQALGDPRGIDWSPDGGRAYITGMGSNNVAVVDGSLNRIGLVEVGAGPTGLRVDDGGDRVYILGRFEGAISVIDSVSMTETQRLAFHDPTPPVIRLGRPFLYDTHETSGLGQASCAGCHIDGRMDQVAWDLGNPAGTVKPFDQECQVPGIECEDWHPMKGPLITQTLVGIIGTEPFHWRGDRMDLASFNPAFVSLMGDDGELTDLEMAQFEAFIATLTPPPNPFRTFTGSLPASMPNGGDPIAGQTMFGLCSSCHAGSAGTSGNIMPLEMNGGDGVNGTQSIKIPQLRNLFEKTGFDRTSADNNRGFGYLHDGSTDTVFNFLGVFPFGDQQRLDSEAFLMCFSTDTHSGVGTQVTVPAAEAPARPAGVSELIALAATGEVGLVVKGIVDGEHRGFYLADDGVFQSDRADEVADEQTLLQGAAPGAELTFTIVPDGTALRIGVDRDEDGFFDRDEIDAGSDPADPASTPDTGVPGDVDGDGTVGIMDFLGLLAAWGPCPDPPASCPADLTGDGIVGLDDLETLLKNWD
ncbi:MAG: hypothetical protein ACYSU7_16645, partial [Planctomycetota bacterium]